jgi:hypothetical protein
VVLWNEKIEYGEENEVVLKCDDCEIYINEKIENGNMNKKIL